MPQQAIHTTSIFAAAVVSSAVSPRTFRERDDSLSQRAGQIDSTRTQIRPAASNV
jgi:hypothetical protein